LEPATDPREAESRVGDKLSLAYIGTRLEHDATGLCAPSGFFLSGSSAEKPAFRRGFRCSKSFRSAAGFSTSCSLSPNGK
jgi:hypothetical protein